jgi:hypothetical protein
MNALRILVRMEPRAEITSTRMPASVDLVSAESTVRRMTTTARPGDDDIILVPQFEPFVVIQVYIHDDNSMGDGTPNGSFASAV